MIERHIRSIDDLGRSGIEEILALSDHFHEVSTRRIPKVPALRGKTIALLFYEDSTRTRLSFETASKRLSADSLNFSIRSSSVKKGESLRDTVETISAMGVDAIVVRHGSAESHGYCHAGLTLLLLMPEMALTNTQLRHCLIATRYGISWENLMGKG